MADITALFPYQVLSRIADPPAQAPTFSSLTRLQSELDANARAITTHLGGGRHGHLVLTQQLARLQALPGYEPFVVPVNPGPLPVYPNTATERTLKQVTDRFKLATTQYKTYHDTDRALKKLVLQACDELYLEPLRDPVHGFTELTTLQILTHLWAQFGTITRAELRANSVALLQPFWQPHESIEGLFKAINQRAALGIAANAPYPDSMLEEAVYINVENTGLFTTWCEQWRTKPDAEKTYLHSQAFFRRAYADRNRTTAFSQGYHGAHATKSTTPVKQPNTATNSNTPIQVSEQIAQAVALALNQVDDKIARAVSTALKKSSRANKKQKRSGTPPRDVHYCWSHGESTTHNSVTCLNKKPGHQISATLQNKMGGSNKTLE